MSNPSQRNIAGIGQTNAQCSRMRWPAGLQALPRSRLFGFICYRLGLALPPEAPSHALRSVAHSSQSAESTLALPAGANAIVLPSTNKSHPIRRRREPHPSSLRATQYGRFARTKPQY
jgi:hypothetical protein